MHSNNLIEKENLKKYLNKVAIIDVANPYLYPFISQLQSSVTLGGLRAIFYGEGNSWLSTMKVFF